MKVKIIYASRYGSTKEVSDWIAQRFIAEGFEADTECVSAECKIEGYNLVLLGSGIYTHEFFLPEMNSFIELNAKTLQNHKTALFGVAMQTETVLVDGSSAGGVTMLEKYAKQLGKSCLAGTMLHGEMAFSMMSKEDQTNIDRFYKMISLSENDIKERKRPRTLMNKPECWAFAEKLIRLSRGDT